MMSLNNPSRYNIFDILFVFYCHVAIKREDLPPSSSQLKISRWKLTGHARKHSKEKKAIMKCRGNLS